MHSLISMMSEPNCFEVVVIVVNIFVTVLIVVVVNIVFSCGQ